MNLEKLNIEGFIKVYENNLRNLFGDFDFSKILFSFKWFLVICFISTQTLIFSQTTITKSIATGIDDVEEEGPDGIFGGPGYMYRSSTTIELIRDDWSPSSGNQKIGLRFTGMTIPANALITSAFLTFVAKTPVSPNVNTGTTNLTLRGEATDNSGEFTTTFYNVSNRSTTSASASWSPGSWTSGSSYNSASLVTVIQEIVNRAGWTSGNAMSLIITGSGSRTAYSYEDNPTFAPKLTVTYTTASPINLSTSVTNVLCRRNATGAIDLSVSGGVPGYTYDWSNNGPNHPDIDPQDLINVAAGSYVVTVTDAVGTTATAIATITQPATAVSLTSVITNVSGVGADNGGIDITPTGGISPYTYLWSNNSITQDIQNLSVGSYQVTVTDNNGCTTSSSFQVIQNQNAAIVSKQLYLSDELTLDRVNPSASPVDNSTSLTATLSNAAVGVVVQNVTSTSTTSSTTINLSHTINVSDNRLLLVGISLRDRTVNSITYGGVAMTLVGTANRSSDSRVYIYRIVNPPIGTANVTVTLSGSPGKGAVVGAISYSGVNQSTPLGAFASGNADSNNPSIAVPSASGDLVFDVLSDRITSAISPGAGQTTHWNPTSGEIRGAASTELASSSSTTMSWTVAKGKWCMGGVAIKPAAVVNNVTFTQSPVMCSPLTIKSGQAITLNSYVNLISGSMPVNPNITAVIRYGGTNIITLTNPTFSNGILSWTGNIGSDFTVPAGQAIVLQITTAQSGVSFQIRHDSNLYPSKIVLPVSTYINVNSLDVFNASHPNGSSISQLPNIGSVFIRIPVTDPFGASDITSVNLTLTEPNGGTQNITLTNDHVVANLSCGKIYQYTWLNPGNLGDWTIQATANEGSEGVTHTNEIIKEVIVPSEDVVVLKQLYLSDPSQALDRIDPVNTNDGTTAQTSTLSGPITTSVILTASEDVEIWNGTNGTTHNYGSCDKIYINGSPIQRDLLKFNLSGIPSNATVSSAIFKMVKTGGSTTGTDFNVHRITNSWTEGSGSCSGAAGVANFNQRESGTNWITAGGDFNATAEATTTVSSNGNYTWSITNLVQNWVNGTHANNGLMVKFATEGVSREMDFGSRQNGTAGNRPTLDVTYTTPGNSTTFTQNIPMCSPLTIKANQTITVRNYVSIISGTMPANPNITVQLRNNGTTFATISNPVFANGILTWTTTLPSDLTIPAGHAVSLVVTNAQVGVSFRIDYDSKTKPSLIEFPVTTFINITSFAAYDAAFPSGSIITKAQNGTTVYLRATVTDPFGTSDITGLALDNFPLGIFHNATSVATSGCTRTYQYVWNTPLLEGDFSITATAKEGYENTVVDFEYLDFSLCPLSVTAITIQVPTCAIPNGGDIFLSVTGGGGPYTYSWTKTGPSGSGNGTGVQLMGLTSGNYNVTVVGEGGCSGTASFIFTEPIGPELEIFSSNTGSLCFDGSIDLNVSGGSGDFSYFWSDGIYVEDRSDLVPGMYYVTVTDEENGCTSAAEAEILLGSPIWADVFFLHPSCQGSNDGGFNVNPFGGAGSYTFLWSDGSTSKDRSGLSAGNYTLTITDFAGCSSINLYELNNPSSISMQVSKSDPTCINSGSITLAISGGEQPLTYNWQDVVGLFNNKDRSGLSPGNYHVTVTDNKGCTAISSITMNTPDCDITALDICSSALTDRFSVTADPNITSYNWTVPTGALIVSGQGTSSIIVNWSNVEVESDEVCVSAENDCGESSQTCTPVYIKIVNAVASVQPVCIGTDLNLSGSGGISYSWNGPNNFISNLENPLISNASLSHSGTYTVTVTNENGCTGSASVDVVVNSSPSATINVIQNSDCTSDDGSIELAVSGGSAPNQYIWSNGVQTANLSSLTLGLYQVTVTDANGCVDIEYAALSASDGLILQTQKSNISCFGMMNGTAHVNVSNGSGDYSYLWSNGSTQSSISNLRPGSFNITVTDLENGCIGVETVNITQPPILLADRAVVNINCFGQLTGAINLSVTGGSSPYNYDWSDILGTNNVMNRSGLAAGTYIVTITDLNSCATVLNVPVNQPISALDLNLTPGNVSCFGNANGFINLNIIGGTAPYQILWSTGQTVKDISGLTPGTYTVTVTDTKSCSTSASVVVSQPTLLTLSHSKTDVSCAGALNGAIDLSVNGGIGNYNYFWSNGVSTQDLTNLTANTYIVTVSDQNNCIASTSILITEPTVLTASAVANPTTCQGGSNGNITVSNSGGTPPYSYLWSDGAVTQNRSGLLAGNYILTITDANLCTRVVITAIGQPQPITTEGISRNLSCHGSNDGSIDFDAFGGNPPFTYLWNDGNTNKDRSSLSVGIYQVTVTDANSCTTTASFSVNQPSILSVNAIPVNTSCFGIRDGSINTNVSGGIAPYLHSWSNGFSTSSISSLGTGLYSLTVTDKNGCTVSATTVINQPTRLLNSGIALPSCPTQNNGNITLNTSGGTMPYQYNWSDSGPNTSIRSGLSPGGYIVTVVDNNNCSYVSSFVLEDIQLVLFPIEPTCGKNPDGTVFVRSDGEIYAKISGGVAPYSYIWSNGFTEEHNKQLSSGLYSVTIGSGACQITSQVLLSSSVCIPPVANDDFYLTEMNVPVSGNIAINDYDPNTEYPLTFLPLGFVNESSGIMNWDTSFNGTFEFIPAQNYFGTFSIPYQVCDTMELCDIGNLTIRVERPTIGMAKTITTGPINNEDGTYNLTYEILVENMCLFNLREIQVEENLDETFNGALSYTINSVSSPDFSINYPGFDGSTNINLLSGNDSLEVLSSGIIEISITVEPGLNRGPYLNSALGKAISPTNTQYTDLSQNGIHPDPDQDGDPTNNNEPTPLLFCPAAIVTGPSNICIGSTTTMSPTSNGTWTSSDPSIATITNLGIVTALAEGVVTFTYSQSGCTSEPSNPVTIVGKIATVTGSTSICPGATTTLTPSTGGTWTSTNPSVAVINNAGIVTGVATGSASFIFTETATGCSSPPSHVVLVNNNPAVSITGPNIFCVGQTTQLSPSSGGTWISNHPLIASVNNSGLVTGLSSGVATFTYTHTSGCVSNPTSPVTINGRPSIFLTGADEICIGTTTTLLPSTGGIWSSNNNGIATITNAGIVTGVASGLATFTFLETSSGCTSLPSEEILVKPKPIVEVTGPQTICIGGTSSLSPGSNGIWTSSNNSIAAVSNAGIVFGFGQGSATFTFRSNETLCFSDPTTAIVVNGRPNISFSGPTTICVGSNTSLSPSTGGTWSSSNPAIAQINNSGLVTAISAGTVTFTFTSSTTGCISNASGNLTVVGRPTVNITGPLSICIGSTTTLSPSSGGTWTSSNSAIATVNNSGIVTGVSQGNVVFYYTENTTGCTSLATVSISVSTSPNVAFIGPETICSGSVTSVSPISGGVWTSSNTLVATITNSGVVTGVSNGIATLSFTSTGGCTSTTGLQVNVIGRPVVTLSGPSSICIGTTTTILPSTGGIWTSSDPQVASITNTGLVTGISAGTATFTFVDNVSGCVSNASALITVNGRPNVSISGSSNICAGASTTLTPTVGGSWSSTNPTVATVSNSGIVQGLSAGTATFIFTQTSTGCVSNATLPVTVIARPVVEITGLSSICIGATTTLSPNSGGVWNSVNPTIASINNSGVVTGLSAGTARFTFTSSISGCTSNQSAPVTILPRPTVSITGGNEICIGSTTTLFPSTGGTWQSSNPQIATVSNSGVVTGIAIGTANFIFTSSSTNCSSLATSNVTIINPPTVSITGPSVVCLGYTTQLSPSGGGIWYSTNASVATVSSGGLVMGKAPGKVSFYYVENNSGCISNLAADAITVIQCIDPDFGVTTINMALIGNVATNDDGLAPKTYNPPFLLSKPLASVATLTMQPNGVYQFTGNKAGKYIYHVPVCIASSPSACPASLLEITVIDLYDAQKGLVSNLDFVTVYESGTQGRSTEVTIKAKSNDACFNTFICDIDQVSINVQQPSFGLVTNTYHAAGFVYNPNLNSTGKDTLNYTMCKSNGTNCDPTRTIITINTASAVNSVVGVDDFYATPKEFEVTGNVLANDSDPEMDALSVVAQGSVNNPISLPSGEYYILSDGNFSFIPAEDFYGNVHIVYTVCDNNSTQACTNATLQLLVMDDFKLNVRVYLEGPLVNNGNVRTADNRPMMRDNLRFNPFNGRNEIPTFDPYSQPTEFVNIVNKYNKVGPGLLTKFRTIRDSSTVFSVTGQNAIVDWVFVELRSKTNRTQVVATRSGLLQRDGDIVDVDGINPLSFPGVFLDSMYVVVRHRNHLGVMSQLVPNNQLVNFTNGTTPVFNFGTSLNNGYDYQGLSLKPNPLLNVNMMWAGDFDADGKIKFVNPNDDQNILFYDVIAHMNNSQLNANFNFGHGYYQGDFDLNGKVKYDNPDDDKNYLFLQILFHPLNNNFISNFNFINQQIP